MDFKFFSHGLCTEKQNILLEHMREKEFFILTGPINVEISFNTKLRPRFRVNAYFHIIFIILIKIQIFFRACVEEGCSASPCIAHEKKA